MTMKNALALAALMWTGGSAGLMARENPYDVLGKALMPIASVFAMDGSNGISGSGGTGQGAPHALVLDARLLAAGKLPPALQGEPVHVALRTPDGLLVQAPIAGQMLTVCRDGDALWATPGSKIQALLDQAISSATPGKKKKKKRLGGAELLGPLVLPVPQKDLVFLPVLFQVTDAGDDTVEGKPCMVLDVELMDQLAKSLHAEDWTARVWVAADYRIAQVALKGPDWSGTVAVDKLEFPAEPPEGSFQQQGTDVLRLTRAQFLALMGRVGRE
jgi:hypothetical protein